MTRPVSRDRHGYIKSGSLTYLKFSENVGAAGKIADEYSNG